MEMSYNSSVHNKQGVENILKNTFMNASVTISAEREDNSVKAKQEGSYIIIAPGSKNSEVAAAIGMNNFKVTNSQNKTIDKNANAATGYTFTNTTYNTSYTMIVLGDVNGDGQIKATDYAKIKSYIMEQTTLSNIQKMAADVNGDGQIKATDYARIKSYIMDGNAITISEKTSEKTTMRYSEIIMKAAEESGISPYSIATKIIQEVGSRGSDSTSGKYPGYEGYYNFFNWGATDGSDAISKGLAYAKGKGWNNQYTSIVEGAKQMADSYISVGQNTAYFYKFNVVGNKHGLYTHQYMTNVQDPSSQARNLYNKYLENGILDASLNFIIPVYNNMPNRCNLPTSIDTSSPNAYYINGTGVRFRNSKSIASTSEIGIFDYGEIVTVRFIDAGRENGVDWALVQRSDGKGGYTEGFVAREYLSKC